MEGVEGRGWREEVDVFLEGRGYWNLFANFEGNRVLALMPR